MDIITMLDEIQNRALREPDVRSQRPRSKLRGL